VVFTFGERLFCLLAAGDIDDGDGDADDLVRLIARGVKRDETSAFFAVGVGVRVADLEAVAGFAVKRAEEIRFTLREHGGHDLGDVSTEMSGDGKVVHLRKAFVDADVAEVAIDEAETDGRAVVDGVELGEALGGQGFEAQGKACVCGGGAVLGRWKGGVDSFREDLGELLGRNWAPVEPTLAKVATEPEKHVGDGLAFDSFGDGGETEAIAKADDSCGDLSALSRVCHGADEGGVDLELVEGEKLEVA
jgi:hypothetical protein